MALRDELVDHGEGISLSTQLEGIRQRGSATVRMGGDQRVVHREGTGQLHRVFRVIRQLATSLTEVPAHQELRQV